MFRIKWPVAKRPAGGHSFHIVGYGWVTGEQAAGVFALHGTCGSMLGSPIHPRDLPLFSDDLDLLANVLDTICEERGVSRKTPEAERLGAAIIQLYRQGVKDRNKLTALAKAYL
jgi:hypothetical protein